MSLNTQIFIAAILGVAFGFLLNQFPNTQFLDASIYGLSIASSIFIGLLKMLLVPLIFSSILVGVSNLEAGSQLSRVWKITLACCVTTTTLALILGLASTHLFNVGQGVDIAMFQDAMNQHKSPDSLTPSSFLTNFIQNTLINPFKAFSDGNVLAVVLFALLLGLIDFENRFRRIGRVMHILFIGYGKTSQRVAKQLFQQDHQITTVSRSAKDDDFAQHLIQDIQQLDLAQIQPVDVVYVLLAPSRNSPLSAIENYQQTYVDSVQPIVRALKDHPLKRIIVVSSTRVYGENRGERIDDESMPIPSDQQGQLLLAMEQRWQQAYPSKCVIVRPTGIYGTSVARMVKLAETTPSYPNIHWSNRIHIDDLADFLAHLLHVEHPEKSYICTNNQPLPLHEIILWFQQQLNLSHLVLESSNQTGKQIFVERMLATGFKWAHQNCYLDYQKNLNLKIY